PADPNDVAGDAGPDRAVPLLHPPADRFEPGESVLPPEIQQLVALLPGQSDPDVRPAGPRPRMDRGQAAVPGTGPIGGLTPPGLNRPSGPPDSPGANTRQLRTTPSLAPCSASASSAGQRRGR